MIVSFPEVVDFCCCCCELYAVTSEDCSISVGVVEEDLAATDLELQGLDITVPRDPVWT
jgi:hypothetical protein